MNNRKDDNPEDSESPGDIVEAIVIETRTFFMENKIQLNPKQEAKIVRFMFEEFEEHGSISEEARRRFFDTTI